MKMQNAEMEFVPFDAQDVIATSGELTFTVNGVGDGKAKNATIVTSDGRAIYDASKYTKSWPAEVAAALSGEVGSTLDATTKFNIDESRSQTISTLFTVSGTNGDSMLGSTTYKDYNGIYKWISESSLFMKQ